MAHFQQMVDMAETADEVKKDLAGSMPAPKANVPAFPYGLCISLTEKELDKLKIEDKPQVGDMIHLCALAKVTSVSANETKTESGETEHHCRVELQITHLATENEDDEDAAIEAREQAAQARRGRFYGSDQAEG